jgi:hypothetical protein
MAHRNRATERGDYGLDAPGLVRGFLLGGAALIAMGIGVRAWMRAGLIAIGGAILVFTGAIFVFEALLMTWSSRVGKFHERDALLDFQHTGEYAETLRAAGMRDVQVSKLSFWMFPPVRTVTAVKP